MEIKTLKLPLFMFQTKKKLEMSQSKIILNSTTTIKYMHTKSKRKKNNLHLPTKNAELLKKKEKITVNCFVLIKGSRKKNLFLMAVPFRR